MTHQPLVKQSLSKLDMNYSIIRSYFNIITQNPASDIVVALVPYFGRKGCFRRNMYNLAARH